MNKNIVYLIVSVIAVACTAWFVVSGNSEPSGEPVTLTVMNTNTIISATSGTTTSTSGYMKTSISYTATSTTAEYTSVTETDVSAISTNTEPVPTVPEIVETVPEEVWVNINTAGVDELMKLDGIGEVTANSIIYYRERNGGFRNIEEIMNVYGIGEAKFGNIRDYIYVDNPVYDVEEMPEEYEEVPEIPPENVPEPETEPEITLSDVAPVNINTAGIDLLVLLPNVDEQIAQDIITLREELHGFSHVYELLYIEKLEQKQVAEMEEFVTVGQ